MTKAEAEIPDKLFFRIGEIAELVGVEPHVLRYWESEFRIRPQRSTTGQRMYRRKDISRFLRIRKLLHDEGYTIAGARKALTEAPSKKKAAKVDDSHIREAVSKIGELRSRLQETRSRFSEVIKLS